MFIGGGGSDDVVSLEIGQSAHELVLRVRHSVMVAAVLARFQPFQLRVPEERVVLRRLPDDEPSSSATTASYVPDSLFRRHSRRRTRAHRAALSNPYFLPFLRWFELEPFLRVSCPTVADCGSRIRTVWSSAGTVSSDSVSRHHRCRHRVSKMWLAEAAVEVPENPVAGK